MTNDLNLKGVHQETTVLDMPLQLLGFYKRKLPIETKHTLKFRYFWFMSAHHKQCWHPSMTLEVRYWKGDNARPVKYNIKLPVHVGRYRRQEDKLITTDPVEALDFINKEIESCRQN